MGPGRGWVDPVAEKKGAILGLDAGLSTLEIEVGENVGEDWEEVLDQRQLEIESCLKRGLPFRAGRRLTSSPARPLPIRRKSESTSSGPAII
jgi:capsid protein